MAHTMDSWARRPTRFGAIIVLAACCAAGPAVAWCGSGHDGLTLAGRAPGDGGMLLVEYFRILMADPAFEEYDLRLLPSVSDVGRLPTAGKRLIIVADVGHQLYFRVFDGQGEMVVDIRARQIAGQSGPVEDPTRLLATLWPPHDLTDSERVRVIAAVRAIVRPIVTASQIAAFRDRVAARYGEEALCRLLADSPGVMTRRAAAAALGTVGGFRRSNPVLGHALGDADPGVRQLAEGALWSVWFRADTPENNQTLQAVIELSGQGKMKQAEALATRLISVAPAFAEAYNQRAIIYFAQGRYAESARDCQRVLTFNPYHIGALGGLCQCQMHLRRPAEALETLRRAAMLQPYNTGLRAAIRELMAQVEVDGQR